MNKHGLITRLAIVMIFASTAIGAISTQIFYRITYLNEIKLANKQIEQIFQTVSSTASLAAYLTDNELIKEVTNGLVTNEIIKSANIVLNDQKKKNETSSDSAARIFNISSPFEKDKTIATLTIIPNIAYIESRAQEISLSSTLALFGQASAVTFVLIFVAYYLITKPLRRITETLHNIDPSANNRLSTPDFHEYSEIGQLVTDVNLLLTNTQERMAQERDLRGEIELLEKRFRMIFESSLSPIALLEPRGSILLFNQAFASFLESMGIEQKNNYGPLLEQLWETPDMLAKSAQNAFANNEIAIGEYRLKEKKEGADVWVQAVVTTIISSDFKEYYQVTLHDISKRRTEMESLSQIANFDQLTQLPNRHAGEEHIIKLINHDTPFVLILMDLNGFKEINDIYGHDSGDEVLKVIANKLSRSLRKDDFVCRWGGDEFVFVLDFIEKDSVTRLTEKLLHTICEKYVLQSSRTEISVGASFGATMYPDNAIELTRLLRLADKAMYLAKETKQEKHLYFSSDIVEDASDDS